MEDQQPNTIRRLAKLLTLFNDLGFWFSPYLSASVVGFWVLGVKYQAMFQIRN